MKIKSRISGRIQEVTAADWAGIKARGQHTNFEVLSNTNAPAKKKSEAKKTENEAAKEVSGANFNVLLRRGNSHFKRGEFEQALELWTDAAKIVDNDLIKGQIAEAEKAIEEQKSAKTDKQKKEN